MKRIIAVVIIVATVLLCLAASINTVYADDETSKYQVLLEEKAEYLKDFKGSGEIGKYLFPLLEEASLTVLLYTDVASNFTFNKTEIEDEFENDVFWEDFVPAYYHVFYAYDEYLLECNEINEAIADAWVNQKVSYVHDNLPEGAEYISGLRACIQYFGITKEELIEANRKMQEEPDSIRDLLGFLSDKEFEGARWDHGLFCYKPIPNFVIEALYMENDEMAYRLLTKPHSVYIKEFNRVITAWELANYWGDSIDWGNDIEILLSCDLTSDAMGNFIQNNRVLNIAFLAAAREKQLSEKAGREAAFVAELGSMVTAERLFGTAEEAPTVTVAELAVCDLTGEDMGNFLVYLRENIESYESTADPADGRTPLEKLEYLEAQREAQLKAAQTGDGAADGVLVLVLAIPALAAAVIVKRKRRI